MKFFVNRDYGSISRLTDDVEETINVTPDTKDISLSMYIALIAMTAAKVYLANGNIVKYIVGSLIIDTSIAVLLNESFSWGANSFMKSEADCLVKLGLMEKINW